jgi:3-oxoacyl-[acyl-carrier protein] reductase
VVNGLKKLFEDKVVIITGAADGMGKKVALDMASEGAKISSIDINKEGIDSLKKEIKASGGQCITIKCDVSSSREITEMVQHTMDAFKTIDIVINSAGLLLTGGIEETSDELIDKIININLKSVLYITREVAPIMKEKRYGRIVNIASITGKRGDNTTLPVYGASKGGIITLTRSIARELGPYGITCNAIAPHAIMTKMMSYWDEEKKKKTAEVIPVKRLGTVEDVSNLIMFLASDKASFITGETININGGYYMD